jgi:hypothetical protein
VCATAPAANGGKRRLETYFPPRCENIILRS